MTFVRFNSAMPELANIMNNMFDRSPLYNTADCNCQPAVNISETDDHFVLEVAAPGFKKEDFKLEVNNNVLTISGQVDENKDGKTENYRRKEFGITSFTRTFTLHKERVDDGQINASYENGILTVTLAKREEAKPKPSRMIEIA